MKKIVSDSIQFACGVKAKNRFMLAPMTNSQSYEDGRLSEDELNWLVKRAEGGFGIVMTCASHIHPNGKGFPGQLGIFSDDLIPGHQRLTKEIKRFGALSIIQLHHAGMRSPRALIEGSPVCSSDQKKHDARGLDLKEIQQLKHDFIAAAIRSKASGYDGVEVHGAHGYILTQFLSSEINHRQDQYGGNLENRSRLILEIVDGIRKECGANFIIGVRLSPEKFGMDINEIGWVCTELIHREIDFLDISLWDVKKMPEDPQYQNQSLLSYFTNVEMKKTLLTVAGKIHSSKDVNSLLDLNVDFVSIGRGAILHHDFPKKVMSDPAFISKETPVSEEYLKQEGLGQAFVEYMRRWPDFVLPQSS